MSARVAPMVRRLLGHWTSATPSTKAEGASWYAGARRVVRAMARDSGVGVGTAAGVVAALSPRLTWARNVTAARAVLAGAAKVPGVFRASVVKARHILSCARPLSVLSGPKVRAFYRALMGDEGATVVDVWTIRAATGRTMDPTPATYERVARALTLAAARAGTTPARLQATAWVQVRGRAA